MIYLEEEVLGKMYRDLEKFYKNLIPSEDGRF